MEEMMGSIKFFGGNFAPKDFGFCGGQLIAISQNQALYAILGTTWGGDGRTNFALPDMRGRVPIGGGRGVGLTEVFQGQQRGSELMELGIQHLPSHSHDATFTPTTVGASSSPTATASVNAFSGQGNQDSPAGNYWALGNVVDGRSNLPVKNGYSSTADTTMADDAVNVAISGVGGITGGDVAVGATGGGQHFPIMQPNLGMQYIIALQGYFPSRN